MSFVAEMSVELCQLFENATILNHSGGKTIYFL